MALTNQQLQDRIEAIEALLMEIQVAINNLASKQLVKSLNNVRQQEIDDLKRRVTDLESEIAILQQD